MRRNDMLSFDYTVDVQLSETLAEIGILRSHILALPLSPATEHKLQWEGTAIRTWATLFLDGRDAPKHQVATILAHPTKPTRAAGMIYGIRNTYDYIHATWRANPKPIGIGAFQTIFTLLYPQTLFSQIEKPSTELLDYLSAENAHPLVQASIAHIHILTMPGLTEPGLLARAVHYLFLAKYGYDIRGYITPDRVWQEDIRTYTRLTAEYARSHHMTQWFAFMAESMRRSLETLSHDIEESRFHIEFPKSFWELSDRQKQILRLLEAPDATITNRYVTKHFKVSPITSSRDLAKLTSLGLIYPHGKGRSVYYTKI